MLVQMAIKGDKVLRIYSDEMAQNPRTEWDMFGYMVAIGGHKDGEDYYFSDEREFFLWLAEDYIYSDIAKKLLMIESERYCGQFEIVTNEDGEIVIETEERYNPFYGYVYESHEEAVNHIEEEKEEFINDTKSLDELDDQSLFEIIQENTVLIETRYGYSYATFKMVNKEFGEGAEAIEKARKLLEGEDNTYNQWCDGEVYGFVLYKIVDHKGLDEFMEEHDLDDISDLSEKELNQFIEQVDSCWGFYGDDINKNGIAEHIEDKELLVNLDYVY